MEDLDERNGMKKLRRKRKQPKSVRSKSSQVKKLMEKESP
jgi:hypothetical protein